MTAIFRLTNAVGLLVRGAVWVVLRIIFRNALRNIDRFDNVSFREVFNGSLCLYSVSAGIRYFINEDSVARKQF